MAGRQLPCSSGRHNFSAGEHCAHPSITDSNMVRFIVTITNHTHFLAQPLRMRNRVIAKAVLLQAAAKMAKVAITSLSSPIRDLFSTGTSLRCLPNPSGISMVWRMLRATSSICGRQPNRCRCSMSLFGSMISETHTHEIVNKASSHHNPRCLACLQ